MQGHYGQLQLTHVVQVHLGISSGKCQQVLIAAAEIRAADCRLAGRFECRDMGVEAAAGPQSRCTVIAGCDGKVVPQLGVADGPDSAACMGINLIKVMT
jgi:hypothetical protein